MAELLDYLKRAAQDGASDLFIAAGGPVCEKKDDQLVLIGTERLTPQISEGLVAQIYAQAGRPMDRFLKIGDDDFSFSVGRWDDGSQGSRFRVNTYRQRGSMAAVVRVVAFGIPDWQAMHIPPQVMDLAGLKDGMLLVTGTAGSGKSTTQACIIDRINHDEKKNYHIITLEDPIEYLHKNDHSIISQREVGIDTEGYLSALRACMRQAPDVILLGEMRDQETIQTAMTAAETGHLIIATLHTKGAVNAVDRIVDTFPGDQQAQVRAQLSMVLRAVVSQQRLPDKNGGMVPAYEIMRVTPAIQNLIRDNKTHQINNTIAQSYKTARKDEWMVTMDQYILDLYKAGEITADTALDKCDNQEQMKRWLGV